MENFFSSVPTGQTTKSVSSVYIYLVFVALVAAVVYALYYWYIHRDITKTVMGPFKLLGTVSENSTENIFSEVEVAAALGNNFTLSFFVYMDDVNRERIPIGGPKGDFRFKPLLYILGVGDFIVDPIHQIARLRIKPLEPQGLSKIEVSNFMVARWNQVTITMEGRSVDIYLNGAPASATLLDNLPSLKPLGVLLEKSPDFAGQAGLFQAWPRRLTEEEVMRNYKRNTDTRGKPHIPDARPTLTDMFRGIGKELCSIGFCGFRFRMGPMEYVDYEFA